MEEILASIRRIISEDDAPAETPPAAVAAAPEPVYEQPEPVYQTEPEQAYSPALMDEAPSMQAAPDDDVLELTDRYQDAAPEPVVAPVAHTATIHSIGDIDFGDADPFPEPEPNFARSEPVTDTPDYDSLVGESASASAASAFAGLAASLKTPEPSAAAASGATIDDLARSLMRPLLKEWLDANLPTIVEAEVRKEVKRISRESGR